MSPVALRTRALGAAALVACVLPADALACSVCYNPKAESREAYLLTTGLLTLVPLFFIGGVLLWIRARIKAQEAAEQAEAAAVVALDIHRRI